MTTNARDARSLPEEGFHEIQLSAKQLVFLFMATTVVSVVIFLCGVLVGRGVRVEGASAGSAEAVSPSATDASAAEASTVPADGPAEGAAVKEPSPGAQAAQEGSDYYGRLMAADAPAETLSPPRDAAAPPVAEEPPPAAPAVPPAAQTSDAGGFIVQVTALRQQAEATAVAARLKSRGYRAFVVEPQAGTTPLYRVRVGPFADRAEADRVMKRLAREEQFTPWLSR